MDARDVMTQTVVTVAPRTPFKEIAEALVDHDISGVPVVDDAGIVLGIVTEADLIAKAAYPGGRKRGLAGLVAGVLSGRNENFSEKAGGLTAGDVMTAPVVTASPSDDLHAVARRMIEHGVKRLPVVEDGRLLGIVSRADLLRVFARTDADLLEVVERFLTRCGYVRPDHDIVVRVNDGVVSLVGTVFYESDIRVVGSLIASLDGVVAIDDRLSFREHDPDRRSIGRATPQ